MMDQLPQTPTPFSELPAPHRHFFNKKFGIIAVVILLCAGGAYAGVSWYANQQTAQEVVATFTPRPTDPTADWKTYTNTQYGFEIKFPQTWDGYRVSFNTYDKWDTGCFYFSRPNAKPLCIFQLVIYTPNQWGAFLKEFPEAKNEPVVRSDKYIIDGQWSDVRTEQDDFQWERNSEVSQILSTFKFTDTSVSPSASPAAGMGILTGHVDVGPICPVQREGVSCTPSPAAYMARQVGVFTPLGACTMSYPVGTCTGDKLVTSQHLDGAGNYSFSLAPGTYVIKASGMRVDQIDVIKGTVTVKAGQTTTLNFSIDTGIR